MSYIIIFNNNYNYIISKINYKVTPKATKTYNSSKGGINFTVKLLKV